MAQFQNQATVTYDGVTVNSNIVTGEITRVIEAAKAATYPQYRSGDVINYVVNVKNSGNTDFTGITVTDNLGAYTQTVVSEDGTVTEVTRVPLTFTGESVLFYLNGVRQNDLAARVIGTNLVIAGINIPASQGGVIIYRARVNRFAPLGMNGTIVNTATVSGGGISENVTAEATVNADVRPVLSIIKQLNNTTVVENGQLGYTFVIQNAGPAATLATRGFTLTDVFDPPFTDNIEVTLDGAVLEPDRYTYNAQTGLFRTVPGEITVPAATYTRDGQTGEWTTEPGEAVITVNGTI